MTFKLNISEKSGKTFKLELENEFLLDKKLHDKIPGNEIRGDFEGYEFEITGASDKAGFTALKEVEGIGLKRVLLTYGKAMKRRPKKEGKKKRSKNRPKGLRLRKTVRGNTISPEIVQINLKVLSVGTKKLSEVFPEQNKSLEIEKPKEEAEVKREVKPVEEKKEQSKKEQKVEEKSETKEIPKAEETKTPKKTDS